MGFFKGTFALWALLALSGASSASETYCDWQVRQEGVQFFIDEPLCGLQGDPVAGRLAVRDRSNANCLACHQMPIPEEAFHGEIGPPLHGVGARYSAAELRVRLVDEKLINPDTIMPGFYRHPDNNHRLTGSYLGKTQLSAEQVENIVAYLMTLTESGL